MSAAAGASRHLDTFERYLPLWVAAGIARGTVLGLAAPGTVAALSRLEMVGVLVGVPVMLSVCAFRNRTRGWFPAASAVEARGS